MQCQSKAGFSGMAGRSRPQWAVRTLRRNTGWSESTLLRCAPCARNSTRLARNRRPAPRLPRAVPRRQGSVSPARRPACPAASRKTAAGPAQRARGPACATAPARPLSVAIQKSQDLFPARVSVQIEMHSHPPMIPTSPLQAHFPVETTPPLRLIRHCKKLPVAEFASLW